MINENNFNIKVTKVINKSSPDNKFLDKVSRIPELELNLKYSIPSINTLYNERTKKFLDSFYGSILKLYETDYSSDEYVTTTKIIKPSDNDSSDTLIEEVIDGCVPTPEEDAECACA